LTKKQLAAQKKSAAAAAKAAKAAKTAPGDITIQVPQQSSSMPTWLPWAIGGAGILMVGVVAILVLRR